MARVQGISIIGLLLVLLLAAFLPQISSSLPFLPEEEEKTTIDNGHRGTGPADPSLCDTTEEYRRDMLNIARAFLEESGEFSIVEVMM